MKIKKETLVKLIAATIVPGGFIIWGVHEIVRLANRVSGKGHTHNPDKASDRDKDDNSRNE